MPYDPVTIRSELVSERGLHDMVVEKSYEAPADDDDRFKHYDLANADWMHKILTSVYRGIPWRCIYDGRNKMAYFSIPILMGINKYWAINLTTDELTRELLMRAGGELLERYKLPRDRFSLGAFLEAREKHSALALPSRRVPE